jgi:ketosteroid isomerase-like protein
MSKLDTAKQAYELFNRGDIPALLEMCSDQCEWIIPGPKDVLPWAGTWNGRKGIGEFFQTLAANLDFSDFHTKRMIEADDTVVVIGSGTSTAKKTGKTVSDDEWVHVMRYDADGKLMFFQTFEDTAAAVAQMTP